MRVGAGALEYPGAERRHGGCEQRTVLHKEIVVQLVAAGCFPAPKLPKGGAHFSYSTGLVRLALSSAVTWCCRGIVGQDGIGGSVPCWGGLLRMGSHAPAMQSVEWHRLPFPWGVHQI